MGVSLWGAWREWSKKGSYFSSFSKARVHASDKILKEVKEVFRFLKLIILARQMNGDA